jgi:hypothetical protein
VEFTGYSKTRVKAMYEMLETSLYLAISHPQLGMLGYYHLACLPTSFHETAVGKYTQLQINF